MLQEHRVQHGQHGLSSTCRRPHTPPAPLDSCSSPCSQWPHAEAGTRGVDGGASPHPGATSAEELQASTEDTFCPDRCHLPTSFQAQPCPLAIAGPSLLAEGRIPLGWEMGRASQLPVQTPSSSLNSVTHPGWAEKYAHCEPCQPQSLLAVLL